MTPEQRAEKRILDLGISNPNDIDIEAIAFDASVRVEYSDLNGCAAMLVGVGNNAIATVRRSGNYGRDRFSIAHELGHWELHRGKSFKCRVDDPSQNLFSDTTLEKEADRYASHLLMPSYLFTPVIKNIKWPSIPDLDEIADLFKTSVLATTFRLVKVDKLPLIVACYIKGKLKWRIAATHIPYSLSLKATLDNDSFAYDLLTKGSPCNTPRKQPAEVWFTNNHAEDYSVLEQCYSQSNDQVIVMLYLSDAGLLERCYNSVRKSRA